jgi:hypothetical protein
MNRAFFWQTVYREVDQVIQVVFVNGNNGAPCKGKLVAGKSIFTHLFWVHTLHNKTIVENIFFISAYLLCAINLFDRLIASS